MHSSRMRTVRCSGRLGGGGCLPGGCLPRGLSAQLGGCLPGGCRPHEARGRHPLVKRITDRCKNITLKFLILILIWARGALSLLHDMRDIVIAKVININKFKYIMKLYLQVEMCRIDQKVKMEFLPVQTEVNESVLRCQIGMTDGKDGKIYLKVS